MESPQNLKKRLKSVANIRKITKAMELVAATKMRRAQEIALASRPYALAALDLLANVSLMEKHLPELFAKRKIKKALFVLVASDKGLAGAFNSTLFKRFEKYLAQNEQEHKNQEHLFAAVGEKAFQYLLKKFGPADRSIGLRKFAEVGDYTTPEQVKPLADFIIDGYVKQEWDRVVVFSTHFTSALKQEALVRRVLPVDFNHIRETVLEIVPKSGKFADLIREQQLDFTAARPDAAPYVIEPSAKAVLEDLAKHLLFMQTYHLILEANASEHSARRMAMKTASDNAFDLSEALNLQYNKSRQSAITKEILEITAGAESIN